MSGRRSARAWNTRASMYMPVPAMSQAMTAPIGPVALANVRGSEKMPAPTIPPTTIAVSAVRDIFCSAIAVHPAGILDYLQWTTHTARLGAPVR